MSSHLGMLFSRGEQELAKLAMPEGHCLELEAASLLPSSHWPNQPTWSSPMSMGRANILSSLTRKGRGNIFWVTVQNTICLIKGLDYFKGAKMFLPENPIQVVVKCSVLSQGEPPRW